MRNYSGFIFICMYIRYICACVLGLYSCGIVEKLEGCVAKKKAIANVDKLA
jgi:hypothetical protein